MGTSSYITLPGTLNRSHTKNPCGREFLTQSRNALMCTTRCSHSWVSTVKCSPKSPAQRLVSLTSWTWMIWAMHLNCPLTWLAFLNGLEMPPMSEVMLRVCLPLWPHALLYYLRQLFWGGRVSSDALQLAGEPDQSLALPHLPSLQLPVETNPNTTLCWTQLNSQRTGSGQTSWGWGNHPIGGQSSSTRGMQVSSPQPLYSSRQRNRLWVSSLLQPKQKLGWWDLPPASVPYAATISCHLETSRGSQDTWEKRKRDPGPSQFPAELFQMVWWVL